MFKFVACVFFSLVGLFIVVIVGGMIHAVFFFKSPNLPSSPPSALVNEISDVEAVKICDDEIVRRIPGAKQIYFDHETINIFTSPLSKTRVITDSVNYVSTKGNKIRGMFNCKVKLIDAEWKAEILTQFLMQA